MKVTFIRHQRCYNLHPDGTTNYMRVNPPLTPEGIEEAKALTGSYDLVIVSPLSRCIETYMYSSIEGPRVVHELFREWIQCPGDFRQNDPATQFCEGYPEFSRRVAKACEYLHSLQVENVCVITHSEWIKEALKLTETPDYGESLTSYL